MTIGSRTLRQIDLSLVLLLAALVGLGLLLIYSATYRDAVDSLAVVRRQVLWVFLGTLAVVALMSFDYRRLSRLAPTLYGMNLLLLLAVAVLGTAAYGAQRWLYLGPVGIQPSEVGKLLIIITLAVYLAGRAREAGSLRDLVIAHVHVFIPVLLVLRQPDLGTAFVFMAVLMGMLLVSGARLQHLAGLVGAGAVLVVLAVELQLLQDYQIQRLLVFLNPDIDPQGAGYNVLQSQIAIGSGGLFGKGLFEGTQSGLNFLPVNDKDFIFSVLGEEFGFAGAGLVLGLYFLLLSRGISIAAKARDRLGTLLAAGIVSMLACQIIVNIGMTIGIMPVTGIPLPFLSYGGSSLITNMAAVGLLLSIGYRSGTMRS